MSRVLGAIWEPEFLDCSYGFRPKRSAHGALRRVNDVIYKERTQYIVEADIKGFFNNVSHDWMMRFLEHRISDPIFLRLVKHFLIAGVMEDGQFHASEMGTPQGGIISPVLSNIYLHYVLDLWFVKRFAKSCHGNAASFGMRTISWPASSGRKTPRNFEKNSKQGLANSGCKSSQRKRR